MHTICLHKLCIVPILERGKILFNRHVNRSLTDRRRPVSRVNLFLWRFLIDFRSLTANK